jgi:glycosyltransferase involved in cell wall biosynthesis
MFWVMIDNAPITGGCHYPYDCKGYETDCGNCPALLSASKKHIAQRNFALKKANMPAGLYILTFSSMDKLRAEKSSVYANQTADVIFLPVNEQIFRPASTSDARRYFNLPENRKIIFFAATDPNERRKGYAELCEALKYIFMSNENMDEYMFATAGKNPPKSGWGGG